MCTDKSCSERGWELLLRSAEGCLNRAAVLAASGPTSESEARTRQRCFTMPVYSVSLKTFGGTSSARVMNVWPDSTQGNTTRAYDSFANGLTESWF